MGGMKPSPAAGRVDLIASLLEPLGQCLTPGVARRIVALRADAQTQERVRELAEKCNEGRLTAEERSQYEAYVSTSTFVAILQAKARALLARHRAR